jgi:hypothetical protein
VAFWLELRTLAAGPALTTLLLLRRLWVTIHRNARNCRAPGVAQIGTAEQGAQAETLANECGLAFERAVIVLERVEHKADQGPAALSEARATLERLGAAPWVLRADRAQARRDATL